MRPLRPLRSLAASGFAACLLAGCAGLMGPAAPPPNPAEAPAPPADAAEPPPPSAESRALAARYRRIEGDLVRRGLLRRDGGGPDTPFDARILTRNFVRVALYDEYTPVSGRLVARESSSRLRRWEEPVRLEVIHGRSVGPQTRDGDLTLVASLAERLQAAAEHPVSLGPAPGNFQVFIVDEDERRALGPRLRALVPGLSPAVLRSVTQMPPTTFCLVIAFSGEAQPYTYRRAIAVVRAEHPKLLRESCLHEEIAQGLGLANDSPDARPSIFNDDEEFALLTRQDELMLAILYDPRLRAGMDAAEAEPLVRTIAAELLGEAPPGAEPL